MESSAEQIIKIIDARWVIKANGSIVCIEWRITDGLCHSRSFQVSGGRDT